MRIPGPNLSVETVELAIFKVGSVTCALEICEIQEINRNQEISPVENVPPFIKGMLNLRGNIITILDLHAVFSLHPPEGSGKNMRILVVHNEGEYIGLLVDEVLDVVHASISDIEPPPSNIHGVAGCYFSKIFKMEDSLAGILDLGAILKMGEEC